jgi:hypothetical protein
MTLRELAKARIACVIEEVRRVWIAHASTRVQRTLEHGGRFARRARREDGDAEIRRRRAVLRLRERRIVDPAKNDSPYRVPERQRQKDEQDRLADVVGAKPPVREPTDRRDPDTCESRDEDAVTRADRSGGAMSPETGVDQWTSARRRAAATKV